MTTLLLLALNIVALIYFVKRKSWRIVLGLSLLLGFLTFFTSVIKIPLMIAVGVAAVLGGLWLRKQYLKHKAESK